MVELYQKKFLLDEYIERGITKLLREQDCISIANACFTAKQLDSLVGNFQFLCLRSLVTKPIILISTQRNT